MPERDRDDAGRARNSRPRDGLGRPLPPGSPGVPAVPDDLVLDATETLTKAQELIDADMPFQAHEVLEARWKTCPPQERLYWQGLAQAAVALTHLRRGNIRGARQIGLRSIDNLSHAPVPDGVLISAPMDQLNDQLAAIADATDAGLALVRPPNEETP